MPDSSYGAPQASSGGGVGGFFAEHPWAKWVGLAAVVGVTYVLYKRHQANAAAASTDTGTAATTTDTSGLIGNVGGLTTDLGTIGNPYPDVGTWVSAALRALGTTVDPTTAENALYRYVSGLSLTPAQQAIVSKAISAIGQAPGGPYPVVTTSSGSGSSWWQPTRLFNPTTWHFATAWPKTVISGTGQMVRLGTIGAGTILNAIAGAPIYASERIKGKTVWVRIDNLAQFLNLPKGTVIATLRGENYVPKAA